MTDGIDFPDLAITLHEAVNDKPAVLPSYGKFIQVIFTFVIAALVIFLMLKLIYHLTRNPHPAPQPPPEPPVEEKLLGESRDLLKARG